MSVWLAETAFTTRFPSGVSTSETRNCKFVDAFSGLLRLDRRPISGGKFVAGTVTGMVAVELAPSFVLVTVRKTLAEPF